MRVQLTLKFFSPASECTLMGTNWPFTPIEAQIDASTLTEAEKLAIIKKCCNEIAVHKKDIFKALPPHLKTSEFTAILMGEYMTAFDFKDDDWSKQQEVFNVLQMALPEVQRPMLQIARNQ